MSSNFVEKKLKREKCLDFTWGTRTELYLFVYLWFIGAFNDLLRTVGARNDRRRKESTRSNLRHHFQQSTGRIKK